MYVKIAVGNVKKSFRDYSIYFLTLTLAVCIFYSFNSIDSQKAVMEMQESSKEYASTLIRVMSYVSIFVSVTLGSLILYANNFLIKKRKKELGIYMTLGMGKRKISKILVLETILVGAVSLMSGLMLGTAASQILSTFTLKLFDLPIDQYKFAVSPAAIGKTIVYFGIMFLLVILFNTFIISKYKIIDLLTAGRKNEDVKFKNPILYFITFILCVATLGSAYRTILNIGVDVTAPMFLPTIGLGIVGTVLFFFSLSGFILYVVKKNKKIYFRGLNIFIIKQINSKVNTNFISMTFICLMLFITIIGLSTGISFKGSMESGLQKATPFDASIFVSNNDQSYNVEDILKKVKFQIGDDEQWMSLDLYQTGMKGGEYITENKDIKFMEVDFLKVSEYNEFLKLKGEKEVSLDNDEVLIMSTMKFAVDAINEKLKQSNKINIKNKEYRIKNTEVIEENLETASSVSNVFTIVINDEFLAGCKISNSILNINYVSGDRNELNKKYDTLNEYVSENGGSTLDIEYIFGTSKDAVYAENNGLTAIILFVGIYLGIVFLITSMAVLALQQLSEASDSIDRYQALKRIGANKKMIDKTIFLQTLVYFSLPVILALIHSVVGIIVVNDFINKFQKTNLIFSELVTALVFMIVYVGYFYTTYVGYKNIVSAK